MKFILRILISATFLACAVSCSGCFKSADHQPVVTAEHEPIAVEVRNGVIFADFGKVWFGNIKLVANKENKGASLKIRMGEKRGPDGLVDRNPPGTVRYHEFTATVSGTLTAVLPELDHRSVTAIKNGAMPFRFVEIEGWKGPLPAKALLLQSITSAHFKDIGKVQFSNWNGFDQDLNALMNLGAHTMAATSFMGLFIDGDRERIPYESDGYINQLGWHFVTGDTNVPRATLENLLNKPTWPTEWMTHLIFIAWEDYTYSADLEYLRRNYNRLKDFTLVEFIEKNGLVSTKNKETAKAFVVKTKADYIEDIVDWPPGERDGHEMTTYNTVINAFTYSGLSTMAKIASELGIESDTKYYTELAEALKKAMSEQLINPDTGLYVDGLGSTHTSAHTLFIPLAFKLVPKERIPGTLTALKKRIQHHNGGFPCSVYAAQYLLQALFENGEDDAALKLILNTTERGWMNMLKKHEATITHEAWDPKFKENIDWNHAWGSAFLNIIPKYLIGISPTSPGWKEVSVNPSKNLKGTAQVTVPTPKGVVHLSIDSKSKTITSSSNVNFSSNMSGWKILKTQ